MPKYRLHVVHWEESIVVVEGDTPVEAAENIEEVMPSFDDSEWAVIAVCPTDGDQRAVLLAELAIGELEPVKDVTP